MFFKTLKFYSRGVLLLLCFLSTNSVATYQSIYNVKNPKFYYQFEDNKYKVSMIDIGFISKEKEGFSLFLPNFITDYSLEILRVSSIGHINGFLSLNKNFNKENILKVKPYQLNYYITDFSEKELRQLTYILEGKIIPYNKATSIVIEGYSLPREINRKLKKWLYFKFDMNANNPLEEMSYSYIMSFDKKVVDSYVKNNLKVLDYKDNEFKYIHTYMMNLDNNIDNPVIKTRTTENKIKPKSIKSKYRLDIKRINTPKEIKGINFNEKELLNALKNPIYKNDFNRLNYNLGVIYSKINTFASNKKAIEYFKQSKLKEAYFNLGIYYYIGLSVKENDKIAYKYFKNAEKLGLKRAINNVAIMESYKIGIF